MVEFKGVDLAKNLAGHDRNEPYIIVSIRGEYVCLSSGRKHPSSKQKRKNRKHLQLIHEHDEALRKRFAGDTAVGDEETAGFIRSRRQQEVK